MTDIRLTIVCDDATDGALRVMQCRPGSLPSWVRVLTEPTDILRMPDGTRCIGTFTRRGHHLSASELAWRERRERGGLSPGLTAAEIDGLSAIIAKRRTDNTFSIGGLVVEDLAMTDRSPPPDLPVAPEPSQTLSSRWT